MGQGARSTRRGGKVDMEALMLAEALAADVGRELLTRDEASAYDHGIGVGWRQCEQAKAAEIAALEDRVRAAEQDRDRVLEGLRSLQRGWLEAVGKMRAARACIGHMTNAKIAEAGQILDGITGVQHPELDGATSFHVKQGPDLEERRPGLDARKVCCQRCGAPRQAHSDLICRGPFEHPLLAQLRTLTAPELGQVLTLLARGDDF